jgi:hypothetical protein
MLPFPRKSEQSGPPARRLFSRRHALSLVAALAAFALPAIRYRVIADTDDDFVIVNGWVLRKADLKRS